MPGDARIAEALAEGLWVDQFRTSFVTPWSEAVRRAEERGPDSAAAEQIERFRDRARAILSGPLGSILAALRRPDDGRSEGAVALIEAQIAAGRRAIQDHRGTGFPDASYEAAVEMTIAVLAGIAEKLRQPPAASRASAEVIPFPDPQQQTEGTGDA